jgi:hypothetical protein
LFFYWDYLFFLVVCQSVRGVAEVGELDVGLLALAMSKVFLQA